MYTKEKEIKTLIGEEDTKLRDAREAFETNQRSIEDTIKALSQKVEEATGMIAEAVELVIPPSVQEKLVAESALLTERSDAARELDEEKLERAKQEAAVTEQKANELIAEAKTQKIALEAEVTRINAHLETTRLQMNTREKKFETSLGGILANLHSLEKGRKRLEGDQVKIADTLEIMTTVLEECKSADNPSGLMQEIKDATKSDYAETKKRDSFYGNQHEQDQNGIE